jgi:hypothetical protein
MGDLRVTEHALKRLRQRGLRECDIAFVVRHGSVVGDGVYLRDKDAEEIIRQAKSSIALASRLRRTYVVLKSDRLITAYRPTRKTEKRLFRTKEAFCE